MSDPTTPTPAFSKIEAGLKEAISVARGEETIKARGGKAW